ncbi:recombinase family protein [Bacteroides sp. 214]|uniref:recombinase family protein n=1 Tax=Bacteroides sp. 214 TaxID=2302935 RepID=UPI0013D4AF6D|nr:recombinase family protein [Bacteroides sp. 214]NDW13526.1 recombinase family protein [Bacteroides sp. 214]
MNVIIYCRVSSDEQAEGTSLDYQEKSLRAYCYNNHYTVVACRKEDFSAKHHDLCRPEMKWIYDYCKRNKNSVKQILFLRWDRFTRNAEFAFTYIRKFSEIGVSVNSIENPIDFNSSDWSTLIGVYCGSAQAENSKISKRTRDGIRETLLKGKCANKAPRGYINVRTDKHSTHVEIDESKALQIRSIFKEVAKGLETPCCIRRRIAKNIPESSFFDMLRNPFYIGKIRVPAYKDEPMQIISGKHEALIDEATFGKVQEILDGSRKKLPKLSKAINPDLFLRKFLTCPVCGHSLTGATSSGNGGKYTYYNCSHNAKHLRVRAEEVNEGFAKYVSCLKANKAIMQLYTEILKELQDDSKKELKNEEKKLKEELSRISQRMDNTEDKYLDGELNKEQYSRIIERYKKEVLTLEQRIKTFQTPSRSSIEPKLEYSICLINNIDRYLRDAPVSVKIKLIGSMFPEKVEFDGKEYRTNSYNKVLDLIYQQTNELRGKKKESGENFSTLSASVPRPGVEPGWK